MNMLLLRTRHIMSGGLFNQENTHILIHYKILTFNSSTTVLTHHNKLLKIIEFFNNAHYLEPDSNIPSRPLG